MHALNLAQLPNRFVTSAGCVAGGGGRPQTMPQAAGA
jgi:hypothetical protein